ncbi:hypothetical protein OIE68_41175 [Nocardia vinacea]|uniref:Uncharacterized protein n=1 Tax=Nocardia vinacea TaxID=96468 RepID=A0ABZ1YIZ9_9NOCA|nr:hypothetical protein OIE68_41175 [Nocardia vinacea]
MMTKLTRAIRRLFGRGAVPAGGGQGPGEAGGGAAGVREPRRPIPPDDRLSDTKRIEPDPPTLRLPDARQ